MNHRSYGQSKFNPSEPDVSAPNTRFLCTCRVRINPGAALFGTIQISPSDRFLSLHHKWTCFLPSPGLTVRDVQRNCQQHNGNIVPRWSNSPPNVRSEGHMRVLAGVGAWRSHGHVTKMAVAGTKLLSERRKVGLWVWLISPPAAGWRSVVFRVLDPARVPS